MFQQMLVSVSDGCAVWFCCCVQPAAFCGVVGLKPTYGLVSRNGLIAYSSSMDTVGVITPTVTDAAMVVDTIAGQDTRDATRISVSFFWQILSLLFAENPLINARV